MGSRTKHFLLIIGDRDALEWIMTGQRMAFGRLRRAQVLDSLEPGDRMALYVTRSCFKNPTRDRARIIATGEVTSSVAPLEEPVSFAERTFEHGCGLAIEHLAPAGTGPEFADLVERLHSFGSAWRVQVRNTLVPVDAHDFGVFEEALAPVVRPRPEALASYTRHIHPPAPGWSARKAANDEER